ncbi:MAG: TusE/DsrC/DsvC family sulfur relay protein [Chromatiales bacterium]|nr:TusE/DsrC/DsvC family sulfur relay protein [Chromatiales bacterium]
MMTTEYETLAPASEAHTPWSEALAEQIAMSRGMGELTTTHWQLIHTLRQHFIQYGAMPPMALACGMNNLDGHCAEELFHDAGELRLLAGLPEPGSEAIAV